jgi:hypothetical protein
MFHVMYELFCVLTVSSSVYTARAVSLIVLLSVVLLPYHFYTAIADSFCRYRAQRAADKKQHAVLIASVC